jgi:hypothetical protein
MGIPVSAAPGVAVGSPIGGVSPVSVLTGVSAGLMDGSFASVLTAVSVGTTVTASVAGGALDVPVGAIASPHAARSATNPRAAINRIAVIVDRERILIACTAPFSLGRRTFSRRPSR